MKNLSIAMLCASFLLICSGSNAQAFKFPFYNPDLSIESRVDDLIKRMTLEEKVGQLRYDAPGVERLGVPAYNWWNECLHGVARNGRATIFPQAIGMAATFDTELMHRVGAAISNEARAKYNAAVARGSRERYQGLTFWTPNVNVFRDPRWGRGQETYGEDPFLISRIGVSFVKGLQGTIPPI
ncbi:MAG: glycoside hydrolase family 3 N-terminal domain-containing protein [Saprospiraceae bacterium]